MQTRTCSTIASDRALCASCACVVADGCIGLGLYDLLLVIRIEREREREKLLDIKQLYKTSNVSDDWIIHINKWTALTRVGLEGRITSKEQ